MPDHELPPAVEELEQRPLPLGPVEHVILLDAHHREATSLGIEGVALSGEALLLDEQLLAGSLPVVTRDDLRKGHVTLLSSDTCALFECSRARTSRAETKSAPPAVRAGARAPRPVRRRSGRS